MTEPAGSRHSTSEPNDFTSIAETLGAAEAHLLERASRAARAAEWKPVPGLVATADLVDRARRIAEFEAFWETVRPSDPDGANDPLDPPDTIDPGTDPPSPGEPPDAVREALDRVVDAIERLSGRLPGLGPPGAIRIARAITLLARVRSVLEPPLPGRR